MDTLKDTKKRLDNKKVVKTFALASFLNDTGSDMISPVWPLFVTTILGANMAILGFIDGLGEAVVSLSKAASGFISDKIRKRKVFIWTGYLMGSASRIGYAISTAWIHLIPFRIMDRAGKIRSAPRDAIIADISTKENRGSNFGLLRAADHLGAAFGILICILLFKILGYRKLFLLASIPSVVGSLLILLKIKEKKPASSTIYKGLSIKDLNANFILFLILSAIFATGTFSYSFLLIYAKQFGFQTAFVPVLYLIYTVTASFFSLPFGRLADRIGRKPVLMLSFLFWGLVSLITIFFRSYLFILIIFILFGLHKGALEPVQKALVSELAPEQYRASCLGGFQMITGLCAFPASLIAGLLWDNISVYAPFYLSLGLTIISSLMLIFVKEKRIPFAIEY